MTYLFIQQPYYPLYTTLHTPSYKACRTPVTHMINSYEQYVTKWLMPSEKPVPTSVKQYRANTSQIKFWWNSNDFWQSAPEMTVTKQIPLRTPLAMRENACIRIVARVRGYAEKRSETLEYRRFRGNKKGSGTILEPLLAESEGFEPSSRNQRLTP